MKKPRKDTHVTIMLRHGDKERLRAAAARNEDTLSVYARRVLLRAILSSEKFGELMP